MGEGDRSEPIEVELVAHAPVRERRTRRDRTAGQRVVDDPPMVAPSPSPDREGRPDLLVTERSRLVATGVAVGVVALLLGWVLGRAGGNDGAGTDVATGVPTATTVGAIETLDPIADVTAPAGAAEQVGDEDPAQPPTTRFRPIVASPRTVVAQEVTVEDVVVHESLRGLPVEIVARASGRRLVALDLATGALTSQTIEGQPFGPSVLYVGDGWALLPSWDGELDSTLLVDGDEPRSVQLGPAWALLGADGVDTFWRLDDRVRSGFSGVAAEYRFDGVATGVTLELPTFPDRVDPAGGLVVSVAGGTYQVTPGAITEITDGELIALGAARALVHECDGSLTCRYVVVERATGERADLGLDPDLRLAPFWWRQATMSPDEAVAIASWSEQGKQDVVGLVDLDTGELAVVPGTSDQTSLGWSPDSRFLFFLQGGRLHAHDRAARSSVQVADELFGLETFAVRPSTG